MIKKWKTLKKREINNYRIFKTNEVKRESEESGKVGEFFTIDAPEWITIVPEIEIDGIKHFILVIQYRHGSDSLTLEFPAGMVDPGEDSLKTAKRELLEETGYEAGEIAKIGQVNPNPAFMTNTTTTYYGKNLKLIMEQNLDEHEEIEVVAVPVKEFDTLVGGKMVNSAITIQAYYFYLRHVGE